MKIQSLLIALIVGATYSFGQVKNNTTTYGQFKTVEDVDYYIKAIDSKIEYVKSVPVQDSIAKQNGWYQQMADSRKDALAQREKLIKEQNKKDQK